MTLQPPVGQGPLIIEPSRSHSHTPYSVELLWTGDQPDETISSWQNTTQETDLYAINGTRTRNPSMRAAADNTVVCGYGDMLLGVAACALPG